MKLTKSLFWGGVIPLPALSLVMLGNSQAVAQYGGGYNGWHMGPGGMYGWWGTGWFGFIFMAIFWIALIAGVIALIRWLFQTKGNGPYYSNNAQCGSRAMDILRERYARGEIGKEEFEEKKRDLS